MVKKQADLGVELEIHQNTLDSDWVKQVRLRLQYGIEQADAKQELLAAKSLLEVVQAEVDQEIRLDPAAFDVEKVTEAAVKAAMLANRRCQAARRKVIEIQHDVDVLDAVVNAIEHRRHALEDLVRLRLADYFSDPREPAGAKEEMQNMRKTMVRNRGRRSEV